MNRQKSRRRYVSVCYHLVMSDSVTPWTIALQAPLSMSSPGKHTGVGCLSLLQGIFLTQGSNPVLPHCSQILCHVRHQGYSRLEKHCEPIQHNEAFSYNRIQILFTFP
ncbi:unnamed protein product [Rangifer tarandus platyrhynchus]|uniref:Uncharacterized protein n=1 Tax=Rangifer tarandus platyrhynchus TaxID=3082113 RepID=A0AC59ZN45_RANTA